MGMGMGMRGLWRERNYDWDGNLGSRDLNIVVMVLHLLRFGRKV